MTNNGGIKQVKCWKKIIQNKEVKVNFLILWLKMPRRKKRVRW